MSTQGRIHDLIAQLSKLSEAGTLKLERGSGRSKPESRPPPGAKPDYDGPPDPDDSLLHYFLYRLEKARTEVGQRALIAETEVRLRKRLDGKEARAVAGAVNMTAFISRPDHEQRVAENYLDLSPAEVAAIETEVYGYCPTAHVRKVRILKHRDPETGRPTLKDQADARYARELRQTGLSIRQVALRMGMPKSTVQDWLDRDTKKRAA